MKRLSLTILLGASALMLAACGDDSPVAPNATPTRSFAVADVEVDVLQRAKPGSGGSATQLIGASGGSITVEGVTLTIPAGALVTPTAITMKMPAGRDLAVQFEPHGLVFKKPVSVTFSLIGTNGENATADDPLGGVYSANLPQNGKAKALEVFSMSLQNKNVTLLTTHFSTYEVCWLWAKGFILVGG